MSDETEVPRPREYDEFLNDPVRLRWEIFIALSENPEMNPLDVAAAIPAIEKAIMSGGSTAKLAAIKGGKDGAA